MFEHFARIVCAGRKTFFFGYGIFRSVNEILGGTFNTDDGEETERDSQYLSSVMTGSSAKTIANAFGKIVDIKAARMTVELADVNNLHIQYDGIYDLKDSGRQVIAGRFRLIASAEILCADLTAEDIDIALAAVKNYFLFDDGNAVNLLRSAKTSANFHGQFDIHRDMDLIKSSVKGDVIHMNICAKDLRAFCAHVGRSFD